MAIPDPPISKAHDAKWLRELQDDQLRELITQLSKALTAAQDEAKKRAEQANAEVAKVVGDLSGAYLSGANLSGANLYGRRIKEHRERRDLSIAELADLAGIGQGPIGALERGEGNPRFDTLLAIATGLGVNVAVLGRSFIDGLGPLGLDTRTITRVTIEATPDDIVVLEVEATVSSDSGQELVDQVTRYALLELVDDAGDDEQEDEE